MADKYAPLTSMVLAARGFHSVEAVRNYLRCDAPLIDPFLMKDMDLAAGRVAAALQRGERIAVFGDYDVDGITATCLLTDYLRSRGADCTAYIPGRLEEGYGLNPLAIRQLSRQGIRLIVTVDCGITAVEEAQLCKTLGIDLVITDHHVCKEVLPEAAAVVDPHRPDDRYPHHDLSGVGVAFKLASALHGDQQAILKRYADMVCLGTVADVMTLQGENRVFVARGLESLRATNRPGLAALMELSGCDSHSVTAATVGYTLAPRINAAGRMGQIDLAVELFLTADPARGHAAAEALCELNRQRQAVESEIYQQAVHMLPGGAVPPAIVLADDGWHQGVVGIVASRIAEEYGCPTFLICLDGDHGKASSRSFGGFNLFEALSELSEHLVSYGGHELAAGFTINRAQIPVFRKKICAMAESYYKGSGLRTVLEADCAVPPELLTLSNVESLECLEPCGSGCPRPVLVTEGLTVERLAPVGGGKHLRLWLRSGRHTIPAIYFSATAQSASVAPGDLVDVAYAPQINTFRAGRSVQMTVLDIRPHCTSSCSADVTGFLALRRGALTKELAEDLLPDRQRLAAVWRYLSAAPGGALREDPMCLCRKIVRWSQLGMSLGQMLTCLDIFQDVGLLEKEHFPKYLTVRLLPCTRKADLECSRTMQTLLRGKES